MWNVRLASWLESAQTAARSICYTLRRGLRGSRKLDVKHRGARLKILLRASFIVFSPFLFVFFCEKYLFSSFRFFYRELSFPSFIYLFLALPKSERLPCHGVRNANSLRSNSSTSSESLPFLPRSNRGGWSPSLCRCTKLANVSSTAWAHEVHRRVK